MLRFEAAPIEKLEPYREQILLLIDKAFIGDRELRGIPKPLAVLYAEF